MGFGISSSNEDVLNLANKKDLPRFARSLALKVTNSPFYSVLLVLDESNTCDFASFLCVSVAKPIISKE